MVEQLQDASVGLMDAQHDGEVALASRRDAFDRLRAEGGSFGDGTRRYYRWGHADNGESQTAGSNTLHRHVTSTQRPRNIRFSTLVTRFTI